MPACAATAAALISSARRRLARARTQHTAATTMPAMTTTPPTTPPTMAPMLEALFGVAADAVMLANIDDDLVADVADEGDTEGADEKEAALEMVMSLAGVSGEPNALTQTADV